MWSKTPKDQDQDLGIWQSSRGYSTEMPRAGDVINCSFELGLEVFGCPVGSKAWVRSWLSQKIQELSDSKEKACNLLHNDKLALWNLLSLSFSKKMDYLAALVYPSDFLQASLDFDNLVWRYLECATGLSLPRYNMGGGFECVLDLPINSLSDLSFQHHLTRLPLSKGGLGIRAVSSIAGPAFIGGLELSLPFFTGDLGIASGLEEIIGRPNEAAVARWAGLLRGGSRTGQEFGEAWTKIKVDAEQRCNFLEDDLGGTILSAEASSAGDGAVDGSTRNKIIQSLENLHYKAIRSGLEKHHDQGAKPVKRFDQRDKVSQAWLSALCTAMSSIPSPEFTQAMAWFLFTPSPACSPLVGQLVAGKPLDQFGEVLMCAHLPFDSWRTRHNTIEATTEAIINDCGVIANSEPYGLFSALIPATATNTNGDLQYARERQGLVPDFLVTFPAQHGPASSQLAELKCISAGATWYQSRQKAVDKRAHGLPKLYLDKAQKIDRQYCGTDPNNIGPLQQRLQSFGSLLCLVAGQYADVSQDFHDLLKNLASSKAAHIAQIEGHPVSVSERGLLLHQLRRRLSVSIVKAQSSCLLSRLHHMAPGAREAAKRRAAAKEREGLAQMDRRAHFEAHVRGRRLRDIGVLRI